MIDDAPGDKYEELPDLGLDFDLDDADLEITSEDGDGESLELEESGSEEIAEIAAEVEDLELESLELEELEEIPGIEPDYLNLDESVQEEVAVTDPEEIVESTDEEVEASESDTPVQEANHEDTEPAIPPEVVDETISSKGDSWFKKLWKSLF